MLEEKILSEANILSKEIESYLYSNDFLKDDLPIAHLLLSKAKEMLAESKSSKEIEDLEALAFENGLQTGLCDDDKAIEKCAMSIVHRIGENCGVSVPVRQSTNDVNIDETIASIKKLFKRCYN